MGLRPVVGKAVRADSSAHETRSLDLTMGPFRYALQAALDRFAEDERVAQRTFVLRQATLAAERAALEALGIRATTTRERLRFAAPATAGAYAELDRQLIALAAARVRRAERVAAATRESALARGEFERAQRRRAALERHRARKLEEHDRASALREAAELDEQNALRTRFA